MTEWKPGDVADLDLGSEIGTRRAILLNNGTTWCDDHSAFWDSRGTQIKEVFPLVVIDPEDYEQIERLHDSYWSIRRHDATRIDALQGALRELADHKPDEPGTWGVVEASCPHETTRREWVHYPDGNWWPVFTYSKVPSRTPLPDDWSDLIDPVIVREGLSDA